MTVEGESSLGSSVALFVTVENYFTNIKSYFLSSKIKQNTLNMVGIQLMLIRNIMATILVANS